VRRGLGAAGVLGELGGKPAAAAVDRGVETRRQQRDQ